MGPLWRVVASGTREPNAWGQPGSHREPLRGGALPQLAESSSSRRKPGGVSTWIQSRHLVLMHIAALRAASDALRPCSSVPHTCRVGETGAFGEHLGELAARNNGVNADKWVHHGLVK